MFGAVPGLDSIKILASALEINIFKGRAVAAILQTHSSLSNTLRVEIPGALPAFWEISPLRISLAREPHHRGEVEDHRDAGDARHETRGDPNLSSTILYYTILYYTILYHTILYYIILYYTIILYYHTILYYTILYYTILYYTILYYTIITILYYTILYYTILYYTILCYAILYYTILKPLGRSRVRGQSPHILHQDYGFPRVWLKGSLNFRGEFSCPQGDFPENPSQRNLVVIILSLRRLGACHRRRPADGGWLKHAYLPILGTFGIRDASWLRTDGVNTNGAAAKVSNFVRLGKKVRPGTFGKLKVG